MCHADPGVKTLMREVEARMAPVAQVMNENRQPDAAATGWVARLRDTLAGWMRKETRHV